MGHGHGRDLRDGRARPARQVAPLLLKEKEHGVEARRRCGADLLLLHQGAKALRRASHRRPARPRWWVTS
eukprot:scaffold1238_cov231-Prasinococcus_capsulatus_cf.AAC.2